MPYGYNPFAYLYGPEPPEPPPEPDYNPLGAMAAQFSPQYAPPPEPGLGLDFYTGQSGQGAQGRIGAGILGWIPGGNLLQAAAQRFGQSGQQAPDLGGDIPKNPIIGSLVQAGVNAYHKVGEFQDWLVKDPLGAAMMDTAGWPALGGMGEGTFGSPMPVQYGPEPPPFKAPQTQPGPPYTQEPFEPPSWAYPPVADQIQTEKAEEFGGSAAGQGIAAAIRGLGEQTTGLLGQPTKKVMDLQRAGWNPFLAELGGIPWGVATAAGQLGQGLAIAAGEIGGSANGLGLTTPIGMAGYGLNQALGANWARDANVGKESLPSMSEEFAQSVTRDPDYQHLIEDTVDLADLLIPGSLIGKDTKALQKMFVVQAAQKGKILDDLTALTMARKARGIVGRAAEDMAKNPFIRTAIEPLSGLGQLSGQHAAAIADAAVSQAARERTFAAAADQPAPWQPIDLSEETGHLRGLEFDQADSFGVRAKTGEPKPSTLFETSKMDDIEDAYPANPFKGDAKVHEAEATARLDALTTAEFDIPELDLLGPDAKLVFANDPHNVDAITLSLNKQAEAQTTAELMARFTRTNAAPTGHIFDEFNLKSGPLAAGLIGGIVLSKDEDELPMFMAAGIAAGLSPDLVRAYVKNARRARRASEATELLGRLSKNLGANISSTDIAAHFLKQTPGMDPGLAEKVGEDILRAAGRSKSGARVADAVKAEAMASAGKRVVKADDVETQAARQIETINAMDGRDPTKTGRETINEKLKENPEDVDLDAPGIPGKGQIREFGEAARNLQDFDEVMGPAWLQSPFGIAYNPLAPLSGELKRTPEGMAIIELAMDADDVKGIVAQSAAGGSNPAGKMRAGFSDGIAGHQEIAKTMRDAGYGRYLQNGVFAALVDDTPNIPVGFRLEDLVKNPVERAAILSDMTISRSVQAHRKLMGEGLRLAPPEIYGEYADWYHATPGHGDLLKPKIHEEYFPHYAMVPEHLKWLSERQAEALKAGQSKLAREYGDRIAELKHGSQGGEKYSRMSGVPVEAYYGRHRNRTRNIQHIVRDYEKAMEIWGAELGRKVAWDRALKGTDGKPGIRKILEDLEANQYVTTKTAMEQSDRIKKGPLSGKKITPETKWKLDSRVIERYHTYVQNAMGIAPRNATNAKWMREVTQDMLGLQNKEMQEAAFNVIHNLTYKVFLDWNPAFGFNALQSVHVGPAYVGDKYWLAGAAATLKDFAVRAWKGKKNPLMSDFLDGMGFRNMDTRPHTEAAAGIPGIGGKIFNTPVMGRTELWNHASVGYARVLQFRDLSSFVKHVQTDMLKAGKRVSVESLSAEVAKRRTRGKLAETLWADPLFVRDRRYAPPAQIRTAAQAVLDGSTYQTGLREGWKAAKTTMHHYGRSERTIGAIFHPAQKHMFQFQSFPIKQLDLFWNHLTPKAKLKFFAYPFAIAGPKALPFIGGLAATYEPFKSWMFEAENGQAPGGRVTQAAFRWNIFRALNLSVPSMANPASIQNSQFFPAPIVDAFNRADKPWAKGLIAVSRTGGPLWGSIANAIIPQGEKLFEVWEPEAAAGLTRDELSKIPPLSRNLQRLYSDYGKAGGKAPLQDWLLAGVGLRREKFEYEENAISYIHALNNDADLKRKMTIELMGDIDPIYANIREVLGINETAIASSFQAKGLPWQTPLTSSTIRENYGDLVKWWNILADHAEANPESGRFELMSSTTTVEVANKLRRAKMYLIGPDGEPTNQAMYDDMDKKLVEVTARGQKNGWDIGGKVGKDGSVDIRGGVDNINMQINDERFNHIYDLFRRPEAQKFKTEPELLAWLRREANPKSIGIIENRNEKGGLFAFRDALIAAREAGTVQGSQQLKKFNPKTRRFE